MCENIFWISHNMAHKIRLGWKLIAITSWNHAELALGWNFAPIFKTQVKSPRGKISPWIEFMTTYKIFLIGKGDFTSVQILIRDVISHVSGLLIFLNDLLLVVSKN